MTMRRPSVAERRPSVMERRASRASRASSVEVEDYGPKLAALERRIAAYDRRESALETEVSEAELQVLAARAAASKRPGDGGPTVDELVPEWMGALRTLKDEVLETVDASRPRAQEIADQQRQDLSRGGRRGTMDVARP